VQQVSKLENFGNAIALRRELTDALKRYGARMNPLYNADFALLPASYQGQEIGVVMLPLSGGGSPAVSDVSAG
jgi:hypothetical protein